MNMSFDYSWFYSTRSCSPLMLRFKQYVIEMFHENKIIRSSLINWHPIILSFHMFQRIIIIITESLWQSLPRLFFHSFDCIIDLVKYHQSLDIYVVTRRVIETTCYRIKHHQQYQNDHDSFRRFHSHYWSVNHYSLMTCW